MDGRETGGSRGGRSGQGRPAGRGGQKSGRHGHQPRDLPLARVVPRKGLHVRGSVSEGAGAPRTVGRGGMKFAILEMLAQKPRHGYEIIREMEESSGGLYSPSPGAVYPNLQAMEDQDLVSSSVEEGKKVYSITQEGSAFLAQHEEKARSHRERWESHWGHGQSAEQGEALRLIHEGLHAVKRAVRASAGDADRLKEIGAVLREAASSIEGIASR